MNNLNPRLSHYDYKPKTDSNTLDNNSNRNIDMVDDQLLEDLLVFFAKARTNYDKAVDVVLLTVFSYEHPLSREELRNLLNNILYLKIEYPVINNRLSKIAMSVINNHDYAMTDDTIKRLKSLCEIDFDQHNN